MGSIICKHLNNERCIHPDRPCKVRGSIGCITQLGGAPVETPIGICTDFRNICNSYQLPSLLFRVNRAGYMELLVVFAICVIVHIIALVL